jgi:hypothetical protein
MKYTEEEIMAYARSQVRFNERQKGKSFILGFMGISVIVMAIALTKMLQKKSDTLGDNLLSDERFITGIGMGILFCLTVGVATLCLVGTFSRFYGKEIQVYKLLVKLKDERNG